MKVEKWSTWVYFANNGWKIKVRLPYKSFDRTLLIDVDVKIIIYLARLWPWNISAKILKNRGRHKRPVWPKFLSYTKPITLMLKLWWQTEYLVILETLQITTSPRHWDLHIILVRVTTNNFRRFPTRNLLEHSPHAGYLQKIPRFW